MMEGNICLGAYNFLDLEGLVAFLRTLEWEYPEAVQLIVKTQEELRFRMIDIFPETTGG